jgi:hypothetical protein
MLFNEFVLTQCCLPDLAQPQAARRTLLVCFCCYQQAHRRAAYRRDVDSGSDCLPDQTGTGVEYVGCEAILSAVDSRSVPAVLMQSVAAA